MNTTQNISTLELNISSQEPSVHMILPFEKDGEYYIDSVGDIPSMPTYSFLKRAFDIFASVIGMVACLIPMLVIAVVIKCTSKGTIFYKQERLGLNGKKFQIIKFRTMRMDAEANGAQWSAGDTDPRIFPFGRFLRQTRIDELPQLLCILRGDLSFVGPRPERECFYKEFETYIHGFSERLKVKPGLTGLAQISGGYDLRPEEKIVYDVEYIKTRSLGMDLKIIFQTIGVVLSHNGAK